MGGGKNFSKDKLNKILIIIIKLLKLNNINDWFIGYGTLLGIVRENSCINQDDDIDIVININQEEILKKLIADNKFKYIANKPGLFCKIEIEADHPTVDFYLAVVDSKGNFNDRWEQTTWSNVYDLIPKEWNDVELFLPNNYETKLENRYGDWKTPQKSKGVVPKKKII